MILGEEGTTAENSGENWIQADITQDAITTAVRVATRVVAAIDRHQQGTMASDENKEFDPGGEEDIFPFPVGNALSWPFLFFSPCLAFSILCCVFDRVCNSYFFLSR